MEKSYKKLFRLIFLILIFLYGEVLFGDAPSQLQNAELKTFMVPKYNAETKKLEYILTGKNAQTVGTQVKIDDAKLEVIGNDGKSIDIVITTPEAFYDRVADNVKGDKDVHYRSLEMDADGIGFTVNNANKKIHIDKNVKMWIYQNGREPEKENSDKREKTELHTDISKQNESDTSIINENNSTDLSNNLDSGAGSE